MDYDVKIVNCGNVVEIYKYINPISSGYKITKPRQAREQTEQVKNENLQRSIKKRKSKQKKPKALKTKRQEQKANNP